MIIDIRMFVLIYQIDLCPSVGMCHTSATDNRYQVK